MINNMPENGGSNVTGPQADSLGQESLLHICIQHRWLILSAVLFCLVAAFLYVLKATPIYISESTLYVEQTGPRLITEFEGVMTQSKNYLYTQAKLMKSRDIISDVVDNPDIRGMRTFTGIDNPVAYIKSNLQVRVGKTDDIITVTFDSPYPEEAAQIVNEVVDSYIGFHSIRKRSTVSEVLHILKNVKVKRDAELSEKFEELLDFTRQNGVVSFEKQHGNVVLLRLAKLSEALTEAQLAIINAKADYKAAKSMADEPAKIKQFAKASPGVGVRVFVNDAETQLRADLKDARVELLDLMYYCTEDHPAVKATHAKIEHIKSELNEEAKEFADAYIEVMRLRSAAAKERESELEISFDSQRLLARELGIKATEYSVLQSELQRAKRNCEILDNRIKELNVNEDTGALNISILEVARAAGSPFKPQKGKIMAIAMVLGLILGGGMALLRDWMDYRLRSADEIFAILGIPVLGVVPSMPTGPTMLGHSQKAWQEAKSSVYDIWRKICRSVYSASGLAKGKATSSRSPSTLQDIGKFALDKHSIVARGQKVYLEPKSIVAEAYRTIRTAVFFGAAKGQAKTILITSPAPGDGKTTLASNLAITMAQADQKTLIIDADFRKPMQHNIFEVDKTRGLSNILAGTATFDEAIQSGPVDKLDILSCGQDVPNPSEILNSDAFAETLNRLSERYDRIIVDSPPVGPVADSQILSAICDVTIMVLRADKSTRRLSQQACEGLVSVGGRLLGAVVNDATQKHGNYGYYGGYGYYRSYGYYGHDKKAEESKEYSHV